MNDFVALAKLLGAVDYTPPPMRAIRGVSFTYQQFDAFIDKVIEDNGHVAWQPMATAPKDGTAVLALLDGSDVPHAIRWDKDLARWCMAWDGFELSAVNGPRYWMRCPDDPDGVKGGAK